MCKWGEILNRRGWWFELLYLYACKNALYWQKVSNKGVKIKTQKMSKRLKLRSAGMAGRCLRGQTRLGWGCRHGQVTGTVGGWNSVHITMQTPGLTMEAPSVPVSHYKSGVTQSTEDNRPPHLIKWHRLLLRAKAAIDFTLIHSPVRERRAGKAASRLARIIHPASLKVSIVYSRLQSNILLIKIHLNDTVPAVQDVHYIKPKNLKYPQTATMGNSSCKKFHWFN